MGCHAGLRETAGEASPRSAGGCRMPNALELVEVDSDRLEEVLRRAEQSLDEKDAELIRAVFESYAYVTDLVEDKNTTIRRLRQLFFGARTEKTEAVVGPKAGASEGTASPDVAAGSEPAAGEGTTNVSDAAVVPKGHGRNGAEAYRGAQQVDVAHPSLRAGDACPACGEGTVYEKAPGVLVRITGQPPLAATVYQLQKLRCHLCGQVHLPGAFSHQLQDLNRRVVVVQNLPLSRLPDQLIKHRREALRHRLHHLPLGRGRQRDTQVPLQAFEAIERKSATVLQQANHAAGRGAVLPRAGFCGRVGREDLAAQMAA